MKNRSLSPILKWLDLLMVMLFSVSFLVLLIAPYVIALLETLPTYFTKWVYWRWAFDLLFIPAHHILSGYFLLCVVSKIGLFHHAVLSLKCKSLMWLYCSIVVIGYGFYLYQLFFPAPDFLRTAAMYSSVSLQHINISFFVGAILYCLLHNEKIKKRGGL